MQSKTAKNGYALNNATLRTTEHNGVTLSMQANFQILDCFTGI